MGQTDIIRDEAVRGLAALNLPESLLDKTWELALRQIYYEQTLTLEWEKCSSWNTNFFYILIHIILMCNARSLETIDKLEKTIANELHS